MIEAEADGVQFVREARAAKSELRKAQLQLGEAEAAYAAASVAQREAYDAWEEARGKLFQYFNKKLDEPEDDCA